MMKIRLFIAAPLQDETKDKFLSLARANPGLRDVRWTAAENLHITVYFCGDVSEYDISEMDRRLKEVSKTLKPFMLNFKAFCLAPPARPPRMVWGEYFAAKAFTKLVHAVYASIKDLLDSAEAEKPHYKPIPHVTAARFKFPDSARGIALNGAAPGPLLVDGLQLISSELAPEGPVYKILHQYEFA